MSEKVELFYSSYKNYSEDSYQAIRKETFGEDIGQNSWLTVEEYRKIFSLLQLAPGKRVLEIASGSGGPAMFMVKETGCLLTGLEFNDHGVSHAKKLAEENGLSDKISFQEGDASKPLPFPDDSFDAVVCIDSINHFNDRGKVLGEFKRVLNHRGKLLYTDPIVMTGILTNEEIAIRSSLGFFLFVPLGENKRLIKEAGFREVHSFDVTSNMATVSIQWHDARQSRKKELLKFETEDNYNGIQTFLKMVHTLATEKRLSRLMFTAEK